MRVAIIGAGTVGLNVARELSQEDNDVTLVELDNERIERLKDRFDINFFKGDASNPAVLKAAEINDVELVLAVTSRDDTNLAVCQLLHTIHDLENSAQPTMIARLRNREYLNHPEYFGPNKIPIDTIISPEKLVTDQIIRLINYPWATQFIEFADGKIQLAAMIAHDGGALVGHEIRELRKHLPNVDTRVAAIYRGNQSIIPRGDTIIHNNDEVFFIAAREHINDVITELSPVYESQARRVVLVGAGNIGVRLAQDLVECNRGYHVDLIEINSERAERAAEELMASKCIVHVGDAADMTTMERESLEHAKAFCAVTASDETNILTCLMAKSMGAQRTIALINNTAYVDLLDMTEHNIDVVVSPNLVTIGELLKHVRARGRMEAIHSLRGGTAEAIEAIARDTSKVVGRTIDEIDLPPGTTVGAILRGDEVLIAHGKIEILHDDHLVLFLKDKDRKQFAKVEKLFAVSVSYT